MSLPGRCGLCVEEGRDNYCWCPDPNLPDVIVTDIDVLDTQGTSLWQRGETGRILAKLPGDAILWA